MALRFVLGEAGSGKTRWCLDEIRSRLKKAPIGKKYILLVPEQATFQYETELIATPGLGGIMAAQVLSFRRLAWVALQEAGGACRLHIGELGKSMLVRRFLEERQKELQVLAGAANQHGFVEKVASAIAELKLYCIGVADLQEEVERLSDSGNNSLLLAKLKDLQLIYQDLEAFLQNRYIDPDDYLSLLAEKIDLSPTVREAEIWIDGFNGFTPQELAVIEKLLTVNPQVNVTLTLPNNLANPNVEEIFQGILKTREKITLMAEKGKIPILPPLLLPEKENPRFQDAADLAYLEQNYFKPATVAFQSEATHLQIICGQNRRAEVEAVARNIIALCRQGYRYRDIAVLLRDFADYELLIETVLADYQIPFFMDRKRGVMHHPLVELVRSALETVQKGWKYEPLFRYLKTDLMPVSRAEIDLLENHVLAFGIKGKAWYEDKPWEYYPKNQWGGENELTAEEKEKLEVLNDIRHRGVAELVAFQLKKKKMGTVKEMTMALFQLLESLQIAEKLTNWAQEAETEGKISEAREHQQIWDGLITLLDEMVEIMGDEKLSLEAYSKILDAGLETLRLGYIPPGLDQVVVGSLDRSRNPDLKVALVMGVGEGILPAKPATAGLFNDAERHFLQQCGLSISPSSEEKILDEEFLVYEALTRAGSLLSLSYPLADEDGKALRPSLVVKRVKELFPQVKEQFAGVEPTGDTQEEWNFLAHPRKALAYLGRKLRQALEGKEIDPFWYQVYNYFLAEKQWRSVLELVIEGLYYRNQPKPLPSRLTKGLFGEQFKIGISRLEKFQACPFAHFALAGLKLKEREVYQLSSPDLGQFFHAAIESFGKKLMAENKDWGQLDQKECLALTEEIVTELTPQLQGKILLSSARYRYLSKKLKKTVQRAALVLAQQARQGRFRPVQLELAFGGNSELPGLKFTLADGTEMELVGRIDRVDGGQEEDTWYLRVIDYKSGKTELSLAEVYYGLKLQLLAYLDTVLTNAEQLIGSDYSLPAGTFYFYLKDPLIKSSGPLEEEVAAGKLMQEFKMKGLALADLRAFVLSDQITTSGFSPVIPVALSKEGSKILQEGAETADPQVTSLDLFHKSAGVVTLDQMATLFAHVRGVIQSAGSKIMQGNVDIDPYLLKEKKPCDFCPFQVVCQFDPRVEGNDYRRLQSLDKEAVWQQLLKGDE